MLPLPTGSPLNPKARHRGEYADVCFSEPASLSAIPSNKTRSHDVWEILDTSSKAIRRRPIAKALISISLAGIRLNQSRSFACSPQDRDFNSNGQLMGGGGGVEVAVRKWAFSEVRVQIVEQNTSVRIFPGRGDARADSEALVYCVLSISNGGTRRAHLPIFRPVSHLARHE